MTSPKSNRKAPAKRPPQKTKIVDEQSGSGPGRRQGTKQDAVLSLLKQPVGTSISAIMSATGWQQHSVRGFFSAIVRKKLGLLLTSEVRNGERLYQVRAPKPSKARSTRKAEPTIATQS